MFVGEGGHGGEYSSFQRTVLAMLSGQSRSMPALVSWAWKSVSSFLSFRNLTRHALLRGAERDEFADRLADRPLHRVQPVTAVGDVRGADVLARGEQVFDALGDERAEGNLKRQRTDVDVVVAAGRGMKIDAIAAGADRVRELLGSELARFLAE